MSTSDAEREEMLSKSMAELIEVFAGQYGDREALIWRDDFRTLRYTYRQIHRLAGQISSLFAGRGVTKGDVVMIWAYNCPEWGALLLACAMSGVIAVPVDYKSTPEFVEKIRKATGAKLLFSSVLKRAVITEMEYIEGLFERVADYPERKPDLSLSPTDTLEIVYTSGTTSEPKGVVISHRNVIADINSLKYMINPPTEACLLSLIPLSHMLEQTMGLFVPLRFGYRVVYPSSRKSSLLARIMLEESVSIMVTVPAFLNILKIKIEEQVRSSGKQKLFEMILQLPVDVRRRLLSRSIPLLRSLRTMIVGGAPLDVEVQRFWESLGVLVMPGYGLTETAPIITCNTFGASKPGTVGRALPYVDIKIADDGEILCQGDNVFAGYYENSEETEKVLQDGWFHTGDIGVFDDEGFLTIKGRKKNVIITDNGLNVYPEDIEQILNQTSGVRDSCVLGIEEGNRVVITAVVLADGQIDDLLKQTNSQLADYQQIQKLVIWPDDDFPRTPTLKIKRKALLAQLEHQSDVVGTPAAQGDELVQLLARLTERPGGEISNDSVLATDLAVDSLRRVELLSLLEEQWGVEIDEQAISESTTVAQLRDLLATASKATAGRQFGFWSFSSWAGVVRRVLQSGLFGLLRTRYQTEVVGQDQLSRLSGPVLFVANHTSHLDTPTILASMPQGIRNRVAVAGAEDYFFEHQRLGLGKRLSVLVLRLVLNVYPFSRENNVKQSLQRTGAILDKEFSVLIYPEGTRTTTGEMNQFMSGIGLLATVMQVPIVPIKVWGLYEIMPKGRNWPGEGRAEVRFGEAYRPEIGSAYTTITEELEQLVQAL